MLAAGITAVDGLTGGSSIAGFKVPKAPAKSTKPATKPAPKSASKSAPKSDAKSAINPSKSTYKCVRFHDEKRNFCRQPARS